MGYYTKSITFEVYVCMKSKGAEGEKSLYRDIRVSCGCGPTSNLESTNTHGSQ